MSKAKIGAITAAAVLLLAVIALGGIFYGQSTRMSDEAVTALVAQKVRAEDRAGDREQKQALFEQNAGLVRERRKAVKTAKAGAYQSGQAAGYQSGYGTGNSVGFSRGHETGLADGSDDLSCSDDDDVTWLPYCDY